MNRKQRKALKVASTAQFKKAILAGIGGVLARQDYLNKINVFPVPDSDTGTNMAMTLSTIAEAIASVEMQNLSELLDLMADSALQGARGNSGAILAQFFQGMSEAGADAVELTANNMPSIVCGGATAAQEALAAPREGTILSVIRAFGDCLEQQKDKHSNLWASFLAALKQAEKSLSNTPNQLAVLKKAGVVDAGAQGFVDFLHGVKNYVTTGEMPKLEISDTPVKNKEPKNVELNTKYRYCTECLVINKAGGIDQVALRKKLTQIGDSLIVAGSRNKTKVHIHANNPDDVFAACEKYGEVQNQKADDMIKQQKLHKAHAKVAVLTDSGADIPADLMEKLDIHMVPLTVNFGDKSYIDKISLTSEQFYTKTNNSKDHPKTSQPSAAEFNRLYHYLNTHYAGGVVALHMSGKISGTLTASRLAARQINDQKPKIIDTMNCCGSEGLLVTYAAQMAQEGKTLEEISERITELTPKTRLYAAFPSLKYGVRGGRVSRKKKWVSDLLRLSPVIGLDVEGNIRPFGVLKGKKNLDRKLAKFIFNKYDANKRYRICVVHANSAADGQKLLNKLLSHYHKVESSYMVSCGAVIGAHSGPGCLAVAMQELD